MSNPPGPIIPPISDDPAYGNDNHRDAQERAAEFEGRDPDLDPDRGEELPLDPDIDPDKVDSAEADRRASTEGTVDGD